jgi:UPF0042 nucleotide-binding protein
MTPGPHDQPARPTVVVVTGLSGAGKSQALHALEDLGFFCTDNLPTQLAPQAVALCERGGITRVGLGIDVRVRAFLDAIGNILSLLESDGQRDLHVLFFDASDEALLRRFNETRRPHPLNAGIDSRGHDGAAVLDGVRLERERLAPLRARATRVIDTTNLSVHELRRILIAHFGPASGGAPRMLTRILSFGFKYGTPVDADLVLDVRFLDNPYFVPELKPLTGLDMPVAKYVLEQPECVELLKKTRDLLSFVMPKYEREGKSYLTIAIGCTGGRHRSVAIAEALAPALAVELGSPLTVVHRDIARNVAPPPFEDDVHRVGPLGEPDRSSLLELKVALSPQPPATRGAR